MCGGNAQGVGAGIQAALADDLGSLSARELGERLKRNRRWIDLVEADSARAMARFDEIKGYQIDGSVDSVQWLKVHGRLSGGAAAERVHLARGLHSLDATRQALSSGAIGFGHAIVIARAVDDVAPEAMRQVEELALEVAATKNPSELRLFTANARAVIDPAGVLTSFRRAHARRRFSLSEDRDGMFVLDGLLDPEGGSVVRNALELFLGPPAADDQRSATQRRADALVELARHRLNGSGAIDKAVSGRAGRPEVTLVTTLEALRSHTDQPPKLNGMTPISQETAQRVVCDSSIRVEIHADTGEVLDAGRAMRLPSAALRATVVARDKQCQFPGCDRPPNWCATHHIKSWVEGGRTSKDNLTLLCSRHHMLVHEGGWRLEGKGGSDLRAIPP
ncbi:MAG TPA: DUF222 domain-containing protein [Candidatus Dormibacteraeota bacterium]|jgi:hypothetical protein|nr:DUF222 domain-containing protein [Candidatus Dormibacteraeota bacterium]